MRAILSPKQAAEGLLRNMRKRFTDAVDQAKADALKTAEQVAPNPGSEHPYATGKYARSFVWKGNRLVNTVDYAKYTDEGFTRYGGRGTAKPWKAEGGVKYSDKIALAFAESFRKVMNRGR